MRSFARNAVFLFLALRAGDLVALAAGMWFVPRYVSPEDIGAVLPVTSFATFLSLPIFAFAMAVMKESAWLSAEGARGKVKSLLCGVFAVVGAILVVVLAVAGMLMPCFLETMRVSDASVGFFVVAAAFMGCVAPVYTDQLQSLKRFKALAAIEAAGAALRFAVMAVVMPFRALAGYFAGQAALPVFRMAGSVIALRKDLAVRSEPYWNRSSMCRLAGAFAAILVYQGLPMAASLVEQSVIRTGLSSADSAGFYMVSRFSDFLHYLTFPLLLVMFPYTADAAKNGKSTYPYVLRCAGATAACAVVMAAVCAFCGDRLLALMPNGEGYTAYAGYMPWLVFVTAATTCQVFYTNAEVSAGRFGFLLWLVPLHLIYPFALWVATEKGTAANLGSLIAWFAAASAARFAFSAAGMFIGLRTSSRDV